MDRQVDVYYDADLTPLDQTLTVTVTAITESKYGNTQDLQETGSFSVSFDNPCIDQGYVVIQNVPFNNLDYTINSGSVTYTAHPKFVVST